MKVKKLIFAGVMLILSMASCKKDEVLTGGPGGGGGPVVNPSNANGLTAVLVVPNSTTVPGNMPATTTTPGSPNLTMADATVSYSAGGQIRLPVNFDNSGGEDISGVYFQVNGAGSYFNIPITPTSSGDLVLPITIPANVTSGNFCITVSVYNNNIPRQVSNTFETCVTVTQALGCSNNKTESGGEGITSTLYNMGSTAGFVQIDYETFTVPDRFDIYYGGLWVAGTGSAPSGPGGTVPPLANCSNPTDGYVGQNGTFCFYYDPATMGTQIEVIVSGCVRGGTAWNYTIKCPSATSTCLAGNDGNPRFNLKFTNESNVDLDLYVKDPSGVIISYQNRSSASGGELDIDFSCGSVSSGQGANENISWPVNNGPSGTYEYWVKYYGHCGTAGSSSSYTIKVLNNGSIVDTKTGSLNAVGESPHFTYTK